MNEKWLQMGPLKYFDVPPNVLNPCYQPRPRDRVAAATPGSYCFENSETTQRKPSSPFVHIVYQSNEWLNCVSTSSRNVRNNNPGVQRIKHKKESYYRYKCDYDLSAVLLCLSYILFIGRSQKLLRPLPRPLMHNLTPACVEHTKGT